MASPALVGYLTVRKAVGFLGVSLPFLLAVGGVILGIELQKDISSYYHTSMGSVFVGSLSAIAVLLFSYRGYPIRRMAWWEISDNVAANTAGIFALGVALVPVAPERASTYQEAVGRVHTACALGLFLMLAYFCLVLFKRTSVRVNVPIYKVCGAVILLTIGWMFVHRAIEPDVSIFVPETIAVIAFGVSWLVKGRTLW